MGLAFDHPQVSIKHPDGRAIDVDEGMVELLSAMWARGIETQFSCQGGRVEAAWETHAGMTIGHPGGHRAAQIVFDHADDAMAFCRLARNDQRIASSVSAQRLTRAYPGKVRSWSYSSDYLGRSSPGWPDDEYLRVSLFFPPSDIARLVELISAGEIVEQDDDEAIRRRWRENARVDPKFDVEPGSEVVIERSTVDFYEWAECVSEGRPIPTKTEKFVRP